MKKGNKLSIKSFALAAFAAKAIAVLVVVMLAQHADAQKVVFVDTEYILKNIPAYETANEQLEQLSKKYESEVKAQMEEVQKLYETYRTESVFLTNDMKVKKENEIIEKEQNAKKLQQQYFGQNGELFKQREVLIQPIQEQVYNAIQSLAAEKSYSAVLDKSSNIGLLFSDQNLDVSDQILTRLGYGTKKK
ncbi:MAG: OmpH family outer membrane protein [Bacteroidales bacterium]|jgi:outer membrane protein|nr:OmpH family outer membrane protein [Bacteroidales bacterium]